MAMSKDVLEDFNHYLQKLKQEDSFVIVEGKNDKAALASLGITNTFSLDRWPLYKVIEHVTKIAKDCVILTDLDSEGKKIYATLYSGLTERGVRVDNKFREFLFKHTSLRQIEGMDTFYNNLQKP